MSNATAPVESAPESAREYRVESASILFSGGTDSTLAAYEISRVARHVTLLTVNPGFLLFLENSKRHADKLREFLGADRVDHVILSGKDVTDRVLFGDKAADWKKYGFNMTALVCLGCRMSMHTAALIYNLEHGIPVIADGSIAKQSVIPEQLESFIRGNRKRLWERYGIRHYAPIYQEDHSDERLDELRVSLRPKLKRQFILFDTQATCPFGVPADVYARLFYGDLSGEAREVNTFEYSEERYPTIHEYIERHFAGREPGLASVVERVREQSAPLPLSWEEIAFA
ncbi:MAG: hypothetical protein H6683_04245 [Deltaproteobacteria bacterium]|nr:hypothetical protein [Deltaproteobacteria bacterium]